MKSRGRPKGQKSNKLVFENEQYKIAEIPLNYQIDVKILSKTRKDKNGNFTKILPDMFYSDLDRGLKYAKETAEFMIAKYS